MRGTVIDDVKERPSFIQQQKKKKKKKQGHIFLYRMGGEGSASTRLLEP